MQKNYYVLEQFSIYRNLVHAISTRAAGDMEFAHNDSAAAENRRRFMELLAIPENAVIKMNQPHGTTIKIVTKADASNVMSEKAVVGADGLLTQDKGVYLMAKTADCLPILYFDPKERVLGVAHAGWRGVVGKLPALMVATMQWQFGSRPEHIVIGIGPCLEKSANLVTPPVVQTQLPEWQGFFEEEPDGRVRLDLVGFTLQQLKKVGVAEANIEVGGICTAEHTDEFFSASAEGQTGRFLTVIGIRSFSQGGSDHAEN